MGSMTPVALGFRAHIGWGAAVAIAGLERLEVVARSKIILSEHYTFESAAVYHMASELPFDEAADLVARTTEATYARARAAIAALVDELLSRGFDVVGAGIAMGSGRLPGTLEAILHTHTYVHTAEGLLYRQALVQGSEACGLVVTSVPVKELRARVAAAAGIDADALERQVADTGKRAGRPWTVDQKESMLTAWLALLEARGRASRHP